MKYLDYLLQDWRIRRCLGHIPANARVLDIGCHDGALFRHMGERLGFGLGIDPMVPLGQPETPRQCLIRGSFPPDMPEESPFDCITALAVIEHVALTDLPSFVNACTAWLKPGGLVCITMPSPQVDILLGLLRFLGLIHGMSLEQHQGVRPDIAIDYFLQDKFTLLYYKRFQFGFNNLYVLNKVG